MTTIRIALANIEFPRSPDDSVVRAAAAITEAGDRGADIICFPECFVPGYRVNHDVAPPDAEFLERAWSRISDAAAEANVAVVLGTERVTPEGLRISALVINRDGTTLGFQDKI